MSKDEALAAIGRFQASCERDALVVAAFLGGSHAAGTATDASDIDIYLVTAEQDYPTFFTGQPSRSVRTATKQGLATRSLIAGCGEAFDW